VAVTEPLVIEALRPVQDPELHRSIVDLGMVQGVAIDGGRVVVAVASPLPGDASRAELTRRIVDAAVPVQGIDRIDVDLRDMREDELEDLAKILKGKNITIARNLVGSYITSLEMAGCSITLLKLDDELTKLWDAPVHTPALRWGA